MSAHDPTRRAEASADPRVLRKQKLDLRVLSSGNAAINAAILAAGKEAA